MTTSHANAARLYVLSAAAAMTLSSCGSSNFAANEEIHSPAARSTASAEAKPQGTPQGNSTLFQNGTQTNEDNANTIEQFTGLSLFNIKRMCSNRQTKSVGTNLISATTGVLLKFKPADRSTGASEITIADAVGIREQMINSARFELQLSKYNIPDGTYNIFVCDQRYPETCGNGRGTLGTFTGVKVEKSSAAVPQTATILANANIKDTQMRQNYLNMFTTVMSGQQPDPAAVFGSFAKNLDMNDLPQECDQAQSPLIIDLAGSGILVSAPLEGPRFDIDADGIKDQISWPIAGSAKEVAAFLALDRNGNGAIDDGGELFGNATNLDHKTGDRAANGFLALASYDSNHDGVISSADASYADLLLWQDDNGDGISSPDELSSLAARSVESISLGYETVSESDQYQNEIRQKSTVGLSDGTTRTIVDFWFRLAY